MKCYIWKNFVFTQTCRYSTRLHDPNKRKVGLPCFDWTWLLNGLKMPWYSVFLFLLLFFIFLLFFCLEPTLRKDTWMGTSSVTVLAVFSKKLFWKLLDRSHVLSSFSTNYKYIDNSILKDILQLKILRTWIKTRANSFIKTRVNIMKRKSTKVPGKLSVEQRSEPAPQKTFQQSIWYFTCFYTHLFLSNNLVFKFKPVFTYICKTDSFRPQLIYLFTFWLLKFYGPWS